MGGEEAQQPLAFVAETVLKKRKSSESLALTRKAQLELGKYGHGQKNKKSKVDDIKRPEQFIKQFRDQVKFNLIIYIVCFFSLSFAWISLAIRFPLSKLSLNLSEIPYTVSFSVV